MLVESNALVIGIKMKLRAQLSLVMTTRLSVEERSPAAWLAVDCWCLTVVEGAEEGRRWGLQGLF